MGMTMVKLILFMVMDPFSVKICSSSSDRTSCRKREQLKPSWTDCVVILVLEGLIPDLGTDTTLEVDDEEAT